MKKICLEIQYNGKNFVGWQSQPNGRSVQQVLQDRLSTLLKQPISLFASGRTDAGVHAICQVAHFECDSSFDINKLAKAANFNLPDDVCILKAKEVEKDFHARYNAKSKTYIYKIYESEIKKPLKEGLAAKVPFVLDLQKMQTVAQFFLGEHNFRAFCATGTASATFVRQIYKVEIKKIFDEIHIEICGNGFLYNMVRIIVGALLECGKGTLQAEDILQMLKTGQRNTRAKTMPACGLYLLKVEY